MNNLRQIGVAMFNHETLMNRFPASASYEKSGKPLLSWRVHLLPYLDQLALYNQFHLDEPWDSPNNRKLIERMPDVYRNPNLQLPPGKTTYLVPTGDHTIFSGTEGAKMAQVIDGLSNTILAVEANVERAVEWTRPDDLKVNFSKPHDGL